jgi:hypothetical protein
VLKQLFEYVQRLLLLAHETKQNRDDIEQLQERVASLTEKVQVLVSAIERIGERERLEREKNLLDFCGQLVIKFDTRFHPRQFAFVGGLGKPDPPLSPASAGVLTMTTSVILQCLEAGCAVMLTSPASCSITDSSEFFVTKCALAVDEQEGKLAAI